MIDSENPLVLGFWVSRDGNDKVWAEIKYEKIVNFCFGYDRVGHLVRSCRFLKGKWDEEVQVGRFGEWMRVVRGKDNVSFGIKEGRNVSLGKNCEGSGGKGMNSQCKGLCVGRIG